MLKYGKFGYFEGTEDDYRASAEANVGLCLECAYIDEENFYEPDAANKCPECGTRVSCVGVEQALLEGYIDIT